MLVYVCCVYVFVSMGASLFNDYICLMFLYSLIQWPWALEFLLEMYRYDFLPIIR